MASIPSPEFVLSRPNRPTARVVGIPITWETAAYIAILLLAIFTRFYGLGDRVMSHDESLHTQFSYNLYRDGVFVHTPLMHGPILFHAVAFSYFMFGDNDFSARLYPAILGVLMTVLFPILFKRWLGTWGALLMAVMLLISPIWLFYNRYIREDTPNIFAAFLMIYCIMMYIDGQRKSRRKARWLYIGAASLLWMQGSKETGFMYVAIIGLFMTIYWITRLYQHFRKTPSRTLFESIIIGALVGGTAALIMYMVISIAMYPYPTLEERAAYLSSSVTALFSGQPTSIDFNSFVNWTLLSLATFVGVIAGTMIFSFRRVTSRFPLRELLAVILVAFSVCMIFIYVEELSQVPSRAEATTAPDPSAEVAEVVTAPQSRELPVIVATWIAAAVVVAAVLYGTQRGMYRTLHRFREYDMMLMMGTLVLPWCTPVLIKLTGFSATDYSEAGIQRAILLGAPMFIIAAVLGLTWNWKRWLIYTACFYVPFVFFFTTMFTNPNGIATGIIGSLGYWLEQQGVRRGSQPQYYYQMIIMPMYEYLPIIGSILAMFAGMVLFWNRRRDEIVVNADEATLERRARMRELAPEVMGKWKLQVVEAPEDAPDLFAEEKPKQAQTVFQPLTPAHEEYNALAREEREAQAPFTLTRMSFVLFMAWMSVMNLLAYTLAGEKMPWLGTHLTVPMIIITAWYFGTLIEKIEWRTFVRRGWLLLVLLPLFFIIVFQAIAPFVFGGQSFGLDQAALQRTMQFIGVLAVGALVGFFIWRVAAQTGWLHVRRMVGVAAFALLSILTLRAAWVAAFINYDYANEFLVYAHGAPGFTLMMEQIEDISQRTTNGMDIRFAWGGNAWPASWYFRDLPNASFFGSNPTPQNFTDAVAVYASDDIRARVEPLLEERFVRFDYTRMWWPMQDYFYLNATRVVNALDFSPANVQASQIRQGIWDIWWARDYQRYGEATGGTYSLTRWPVSEGMSFYVRRDVAAQIWNLGVGDTSVISAGDAATVNQCVANWQPLSAEVVFSAPTTPLNKPVDISVGADGRVYVADEFNNRIVIYDQEGRYLNEYTTSGSSAGMFTRPNGVALATDGNLVVADTWNYRIEVLDRDGVPVLGWGQAGQFGTGAATEPVDGFWGPRDVATDSAGNIYVADTGNKRIRVYDAEGNYLRDIGSGGADIGQLEEPAGLAIHSDGRLFVADTWNRRVSVFNIAEGSPMYTFPVRGWYEDLGNRPYLALDEARDRIYVSDPDAARVLVYDTRGNCVGSFGQAGDLPLTTTQFATTAGLAVDAQGRVYVVDAGGNRILRFAPFVPPVPAPGAQG
jgi:uncharacterized protein (TIGR03663 family)